MSDPLKEALSDFAGKVNSHDKVKILVKDWDRNIVLYSINKDEVRFTLLVRDSCIAEIAEGEVYSERTVRLEADDATFHQVFTGDRNPVDAVLTGDMAIFGEAADYTKLDTISMLIWEV